MSRLSVLPCFGLMLVFISGLDFVVAQQSVNDKVKQIFHLLDSDNNRFVNEEEFSPLYDAYVKFDLPHPGTKCEEFRKAAKCDNTKITSGELEAYITSNNNRKFVATDKNGDGKVSLPEMREMMQDKYPQDEVDKYFASVDTDNSGSVSETEGLADEVKYLLSELKKVGVAGSGAKLLMG